MHEAPAAAEPVEFWSALWFHIGASPAGLVGVLIATVVLYLFFTLLLTAAGPRLVARPSTFTLVVTICLGSIAARAMLGNTPTLAGALVAMNTLMAMEFLFRRLRRSIRPLLQARRRGRTRFGLAGHASVIMADGAVQPDLLRRRALTEDLLMVRLRGAGIHRVQDVALAILEPRGDLTVLRRGETIDAALVADVVGRDRIPPHLITPPEEAA